MHLPGMWYGVHTLLILLNPLTEAMHFMIRVGWGGGKVIIENLRISKSTTAKYIYMYF